MRGRYGVYVNWGSWDNYGPDLEIRLGIVRIWLGFPLHFRCGLRRDLISGGRWFVLSFGPFDLHATRRFLDRSAS